MKTIELRRYEIFPGELPAFVSWWSEWMPTVRANAGFTIEFAYVNAEANEFIWAVSAPVSAEEFASLDATYKVSDARAAAFEGVPQRVKEMHVSIIESLTDPRQ
jgi:hypothetical protein